MKMGEPVKIGKFQAEEEDNNISLLSLFYSFKKIMLVKIKNTL
jgi:hypothetical protein